MVESAKFRTNGSSGNPLDRDLETALRVWFRRHQRDLPWRKQKSLYRVWVSEIMLQQTQVATVIDYYRRFLAAFPNVRRLAEANEQDVLKLWEGLGYYRRAKQLHRAAQIIVEKHQGRFPKKLSDVLALPGIGRYTAGAILSIGADQRLPILEGNTIRLYSRLLGSKLDVKSSVAQKQLWAFAESIVPLEKPGEFNQALMELGSQVCLVRNPRCGQCPLRPFCAAAKTGNPEQFPVNSQKTRYEDRSELVLFVRTHRQPNKAMFLVRQCQPSERWAGLWDFPRLGLEEPLVAESGQNWIEQQQLSVITKTEWPKPYRHAVTKFRILLTVTELLVRGPSKKSSGYRWINWDELTKLPLNTTARKIVRAFSDSVSAP